MRTRTSTIVVVTLLVAVVASAGTFFGCMYFKERQRIEDADRAFLPIVHLGCYTLSHPVAFCRYDDYCLEFPPDCELSDANADELRSLNRLPPRNGLFVRIHARGLTDESLPYLKAIRTFDSLDVTNTSISDEGIEELRRTLPDVDIPSRQPK